MGKLFGETDAISYDYLKSRLGLKVMLDFIMKRTTAGLTIYTLQHITAVTFVFMSVAVSLLSR